MPTFTYKIDGYNRVANKLRKTAAEMPEVTSVAVYKWAQLTRGVLKSTPYPERNRKKMRWASEKQRRFVMAAIRRGDIQVPYRRTGRLASSWRAKKTPTGAILTNSRGYSVYVIGNIKGDPNSQYWMHRGRWWLARNVINREAKDLPKMIRAAIKKAWEKA